MLPEKEITSFNLTKRDDYEKIVSAMTTSESIVFAMPLYVDGIPSHMLSFLEYIEAELKDKNKHSMVYLISNCGFYEGIQNKHAIAIMKCWCQRTGFKWGQGLGIGAGEMIGSLKDLPNHQGPKKSFGRALQVLAEHINEGKSGENLYTTPNYFPKILFPLCSNQFWINLAKGHGLKKSQLNKRL
jgi:multimeric flavodoxin WrbA